LSLTGEGFPSGPCSVTMYTEPTVFEWTFTVD